MTKSLNTMFASVLFAASVFGGAAAFAASDGDYYVGTDRDAVRNGDPQAMSGSGQPLDLFPTQSIRRSNDAMVTTTDDIGPAEGDYYSGTPDASR